MSRTLTAEPPSSADGFQAAAAPVEVIDQLLAAQLVVAWAGENAAGTRLNWWNTDLVSEDGGRYLFRRLLPQTWEWAVLETAREAARRHELKIHRKHHDQDALVSLFAISFEVDERIADRLKSLKRGDQSPAAALGLPEDVQQDSFDKQRFVSWAETDGRSRFKNEPAGRRLTGALPDLSALAARLVGGLLPLTDVYAMPHYRRQQRASV
ncbi:MAG: BREX-6 system BrxE protein [Planctomycetaceae bacterium]|nr:BREX-6 system BrxE protein [Planctomycetaceae bacterium]